MKDGAQMGSDLALAARMLGARACGDRWSPWDKLYTYECAKPAGGAGGHEDAEGHALWLGPVDADHGRPTDVAEASEWHSRYEQAARLAEDRLAYIDRIRAALGVDALADPVEAATAARLALNCGLTADERREPAILVTCRSRGALCAACELARRDGAVAHFRARLKRREAELDAEIDKAKAIRAALGCRDGETTARKVPELIRALVADNVTLSDERAQLAKERDHHANRATTFLRERDAYRDVARANGEQRDRFAADLGRLLRAVDACGAGASGHAMLAEAQRIRDGGAPVDPRDVEIEALRACLDQAARAAEASRATFEQEIARLTADRDTWREQAESYDEQCGIADAEIAALRDALDAGAARAASLVARAEAERDALVGAVRKADEAQGDWRTWGPAWEALLAVESGKVQHEGAEVPADWNPRSRNSGCYLHCPACRAVKTAKDWLATNPAEPSKEGES